SVDTRAFASREHGLAAEHGAEPFQAELTTRDRIGAFNVPGCGKKPTIGFVALGRDATSLAHGEDNEPTGVFVSNGSTTHLLGTAENLEHARGFFTMQHGDNTVYEFLRVGKERQAAQ